MEPLLAMGPGAMGHGGHRGRRDGAMRGGRSGWEGRSKRRVACTGALYGARSHGSLCHPIKSSDRVWRHRARGPWGHGAGRGGWGGW